jgi:hypothetical protein
MGNAGSVPAVYDEPARGITVLLLVLTTVCVIARMSSRSLQGLKLGIDDFMTLLAFVSWAMHSSWS